ncbi:MAG: ABC transporter permease [Gemmatimonadales bacterium]
MSLIDGLRYRLRAWLTPGAVDREREDEVRFHLALESERQAARAASTRDAAHAARRRFGNVTVHLEEARAVSGRTSLERFAQDLRFALRSFARTPSFTLIAVLTLAVGIGGNTAIFSAANALLMRPLPLREPGRLLELSMTSPPQFGRPGSDHAVWSYPKFEAFRETQRSFSDLALYTESQVTLRGTDGAERLTVETVGASYLRTLGIDPIRGRSFSDAENRPGSGTQVAVVSHRLWERILGADPAAVGRTLDLGGTPVEIIGIMPPGFAGLTGIAELWLPLGAEPGFIAEEAWSHSYRAVGRLAPEATVAGAIADAVRGGVEVNRRFPPPALAAAGAWGATARPLDASRVDPRIRQSILVLLAAVGLVLLIACANVANLFLVRAAGRQREIAVRLALGAGRRRLVRQLLTESLLLAGMGGVAGLAVAWWGVRALAALNPADAFRVQQLGGLGLVSFATISVDGAAFAFAAGLVLVTGLLFGLVPAIRATRPSLTAELKNATGRGAGRRFPAGTALAIGEMALAVVLLVGSGLMIRSLLKLLAVDPGLDVTRTLTLRLNPRDAVGRDSLPAFYDALLDRVAAVPGTDGAALIDCPPLNGGCNGTVIALRDRPAPSGDQPEVGVHWISPNWPAVARVPLRAGRLFDGGDRIGTRKVVLVSETAARTLWPGEDPLGRPVSVGQGGFWQDTAYVVGVVGDVRFETLGQEPAADVYLSYGQSLSGRAMLFVRTTADPAALTRPVVAALREVAPTAPTYDIRTFESRVARSTTQARFGATLFGLFAAVALLLAGLGVYGVISFGVTQRYRELGIRTALGASGGEVVRMIVREGATLAVTGLGIGALLALFATRVLGSLLFGVSPADPVTYAAITVVLVGAALLASWIPARRAAAVAPVEVLRED